MRIAIDALGIDRPGGGRAATLNLLKPLLQTDRDDEFLICLSAPEPSLAGLHPRATQHIVPVANRFSSRAALRLVLPRLCARHGIDLVHFVKNQVVSGTGTRSVVTVYDLTTLRHPEAYPAVDVWYWRHVLPRQYRKMDHVVAISESTKADLISMYGLPGDRISVIPCACDPAYRVPDPGEVEAAMKRYGLSGVEYFIHVGNLSIKKNLAMLVDAFLDFRRRTRFAGRLVLAGAEYSKGRDHRFFQALATDEARDAVQLTGHVPQESLVGLYGGALAFVFPSLHEGFGLVAVEAMACGAPVVAHAAGAVAEVVGDAALVMESASDVAAWSRAFEEVARDESLRSRLRRAGLDRVRRFAPDRVVRETLSLYRSIAARP